MLTNTGLEIKRLPELISLVEKYEQQNINPDIYVKDDQFLGQLNKTLMEQISRVYKLCEVVNDNFNISTAEGKALDDLAELRGVSRLIETPTSGDVQFTGTPNTIITAGTVVENPETKDRFTLQEDLTLSTSTATYARITISTLANNTQYSLVVDGTTYSMTSDATATKSEIFAGISGQVLLDTGRQFALTIDSGGAYMDVRTSDYGYPEVSISTSSNMSIDTVTNNGYVECIEDGVIEAAINTVTNIVTPVFGLDSVANPIALITGRERETDEELRLRAIQSRGILGKCTVEAITSNLRNTTGVLYAVVYENDTNVTDVDGRPAKSFEAVVDGGLDATVADAIWAVKGGCIETYGTTTVAIEDEYGNPKSVKFSRPDQINIAVNVEYTEHPEEELPVDAVDTIRSAVVSYINSLNIGTDVVPKRIYKIIYDAVDGVDDLTVEVQEITNPGDTPAGGSWQETRLSISAREFPQISLADVYVTEV